MNWLDFEVKRSKVKTWQDRIYVLKSALCETFSRLSPECVNYFNETYRSFSLPGPRDTGDILKVIGSKVKVTDIIETALL